MKANSCQSTKPVQKITLALGGGAALGWAHIGVLRACSEDGIEIGGIAGTSIGALVGAAYLAGKLDELEELARSTNLLRILSFIDFQLHGKGLLGGGTVVRELNKYLGGYSIEDLALPYAAVAADLIEGEEVVFTKGPLVDAIRASISIPGVFTPMQCAGRCLVDGGMVNPLPVSVARTIASYPVVAIDITGDYRGQAQSLGIKKRNETELLPAPAAQGDHGADIVTSIARRFFNRNSDAPNLIATLTASFALHVRHMTRAQLTVTPPDVHIVPKIGHISMMEFDRADELIAAGHKAIIERIDDVRSIAPAEGAPGNDGR